MGAILKFVSAVEHFEIKIVLVMPALKVVVLGRYCELRDVGQSPDLVNELISSSKKIIPQ